MHIESLVILDESESDIASRLVHGESSLMFRLNSDKYQREIFFRIRFYGLFTLPDTDTDTDSKTDKLQQSSMALLSQCSVNTSTQFFTTHFYWCLCQCRCRRRAFTGSGSTNAPLISVNESLVIFQ